MAINLYVNVAGATLLDSGIYQVTKGQALSFSVTPVGGTAPYAFTWDFDDRLSEEAQWDINGDVLIYSALQNPSHTFNEYGTYEVVLYVRDSLGSSAYSFISVYVPVGGTNLNPTTDCGANNIVGDGITDNGSKLGLAAQAVGGYVTFEIPSGTYLFSTGQSFTGCSGVEIKAKTGASVIFLHDPGEPAGLILHLDNNVIDSSVTGHTVTNNNVTFDADDKVTGTHSAIFNGTTAYLSIPDHTDFDLSNIEGPRIECRIKLTDLNTNYPIYFQETDAGHYIKLYIDTSGDLCLKIDGVDIVKTTTAPITVEIWHKVLFLRPSSGYYLLWVDNIRLKATLSGVNIANYTGNVQIGYDGLTYFKGKIDEFWVDKNGSANASSFASPNVFRGITIQRKVESNEILDNLLETIGSYSSTTIIEKCTYNGIAKITDNMVNAVLKRSNILNSGLASRGSCTYVSSGIDTNIFTKNLYVKPAARPGTAFYAGTVTYTYHIGNYIEHPGENNWTGLVFQGPTTEGTRVYLYKNYIRGPTVQDTESPIGLCWFGIAVSHSHIVRNVINYTNLALSISDPFRITNNVFLNTPAGRHTFEVGGDVGVEIKNNIFGEGTPSGGANKLFAFDTHGGGQICGPNGPTSSEYTNDPNPGIPGDDPDYTGPGIYCATWSGNVNDETPNPVSDPGQWEFTPPTINSISLVGNILTISASDSGSGLGSTPRWPLPNAAMVQVRYADGSLSEIQAYAAETTWSKKPSKFRICDVHQNWTNEAATCSQIQVGTGASINTGSGGSLVLG